MVAAVDVDELRGLLQDNDLRVTRPRLAVLAAIAADPHATVDDVISGVREEIRTVSPQTVYGVLNVLTDRGILRRMEPAGQAARYELRPEDGHQHLVCRACGEIVDVVLPEPAATAALSETHGYTIQETELTVWGLCPRCQQL